MDLTLKSNSAFFGVNGAKLSGLWPPVLLYHRAGQPQDHFDDRPTLVQGVASGLSILYKYPSVLEETARRLMARLLMHCKYRTILCLLPASCLDAAPS